MFDENGMNEICSIDSHILIRFQCWLDLHKMQSLSFLQ